jgi:hypothetical protein
MSSSTHVENALPREAAARPWADWIAPAAVAVVLLATYLCTVARVVIPGDSAELVTTVHTLGIPHPPGYPLFALAGKAFDLLAPFGTVAYRLNVWVALLGVATGVAITWAYRVGGGSRPASALAGLAAGLFSVPWSQALNFEVYTMHTLLSAASLVAFLRWRRQPTPRRLVALALLAGLTLSHHGTGMWVAIPLVVAALALHRPLPPRLLLKCVGVGLLPFALYAYLPLDSLRDPYVRWGDASTLKAFIEHVSGRMFWSYLASHGAERMEPLELLRWLAGKVGSELTVGAAGPLAARWVAWALTWGVLGLGWWTWWRRDRAFWACTTSTVTLSLIWVMVYRVLDQQVFLVFCFSIFALWLAAGIETAARWAGRFGPRAPWWVLGACLVLIPGKLVSTNLEGVDAASRISDDRLVYDHMRLTLHAVRPNAIVVLRGHEPHSTALYLQQCEGVRPDVSIVSSGLSSYPWYITKHTNPIVAQAIRDAVPGLSRTSNAEFWQLNWCPYLTMALARLALPGTPVYVNQRFEPPPPYAQLAGPPIEEMALGAPDFARPDRPGQKVAAEFAYGIALLGASAEPSRVGRADWLGRDRSGRSFFGLRLLWKCRQAIEHPVKVALVFVKEGAEQVLTPNAVGFLLTGDQRLLPKQQQERVRRLAFGEDHPLLYGLLPLQANAPGEHYERAVPFVTPSGVEPGRYRIYASAASAGQRGRPVAVGELTILPRPGE